MAIKVNEGMRNFYYLSKHEATIAVLTGHSVYDTDTVCEIATVDKLIKEEYNGYFLVKPIINEWEVFRVSNTDIFFYVEYTFYKDHMYEYTCFDENFNITNTGNIVDSINELAVAIAKIANVNPDYIQSCF